MSTSTGKQIVQYGLTEVYSATDPLVDIVFVHGLNGHPHGTWSTKKPDVFWPADLLPTALQDQRPRILTYGYDANVTAFTDGVSKDRIHNHAEHLASRLIANRTLRKALERPIIFVCHSLGGLVVKRCLLYCHTISQRQHTVRLRSIFVSTYGILFLGTPHNGSDLAKWGSLLQKICTVTLPTKFLDTSPQLVQNLQTNNETLQNINRLFIEMINRFRVYFFYELKPTDLKGTREFVVGEDSAAPVIEGVERMGIEQDHSHMCKFEDESSPGYDVVAEAIQRYAEDSPRLIKSRWEEEKRVAEFERQAAARELLGESAFQTSAGAFGTVTPSGPGQHANRSNSIDGSIDSIGTIEQPMSLSSAMLVVGPVGFRPNSLFVGFHLELDQLEQKLRNQKRLPFGTCAVLLWGPPGCGKSQIAREYLWRHRSDYPAGCFWVDCKTKESRSKSFWDIAQAIEILEIELQDPVWNEPSKFIDSVKKWFEAREGWLLIFDGVTAEDDDDIQVFTSFIPDRSGNNIIYTSVDRTLAKRHRLLNPSGIKIHPLSQQDACTLLYKNLEIKEPSPLQDKKAVMLVKHYQCLPLAVHAAAHALIARGIPLDKYNPGTSDHRLAEPFLDILSTLRDHQHSEAINLVTLLSFFAHVVPVALIRFGHRALVELGVETRSVDHAGSIKRELDNTIAVLIRYGLVERTLLAYSVASPDSPDSPEEVKGVRTGTTKTAGSSDVQAPKLITDESSNLDEMFESRPDSRLEDSSDESVTYSIDILRIHSVVQEVLRDELKVRFADQPDQYWWWLSAASMLLCHSYTVADGRIRRSEGQCLVRDYRDYEAQAAQLWSHFPKSSQDASSLLQKARHQLHETIRTIKKEIQNRTPAQSIESFEQRVQFSVFERADSTSSDSPDSGLAQTSTTAELSQQPYIAPYGNQAGLSQYSNHPSPSQHSEHASPIDMINNLSNLYPSANLPSDSGYQSALPPRNQERVQGKHPPGLSLPESDIVDNHDSIELGDDTLSVGSVEDEIASQRTTERTQETRTGEYEIMQIMLANEELVAIFTDVLANIGREKFIRNFRRQLKKYYLELQQVGISEPQKLAISLLRRRATRIWIAMALADRLGPERKDTTDWERLDVEHIDTRKRLNEWLHERYESMDPAEKTELGVTGLSSRLSASLTDDSGSEISEISNGESDDEKSDRQSADFVEKLAPLFTSGPPFRSLLANMQLLKLPRSLSSLTRILMTIPTHDISYVDSFRQSYSDCLKRSVEGLCGYEWNWWPLHPPQPRLAKGYVRIRWRCHCGHRLWADVTPWQSTIYQNLLKERGRYLNREHLCLGKSSLAGSAASAILHGIGLQSLQPRQEESVQTPASVGNDSFTESDQNARDRTQSASRQQPPNQNHTARQTHYVMFGVVEARQSATVSSIPCGEQTSDGELFGKIKQNYKDKRAFWRRWFSIWRLDHCDFVKFLEFEQHWISCEGQGLPHSDPVHSLDYEYSPRNSLPPPPISVHEWRLALQRCDSICWRSFAHRCIKPSAERTALERIPKKKTEWKGKRASDKPQPAWGLRARHRVAASRVGAYIVLLCFPFMAFWFAWQNHHPDDPTTASTPLMFWIAFLTLFVTISASYGFQNADEVVGYI